MYLNQKIQKSNLKFLWHRQIQLILSAKVMTAKHHHCHTQDSNLNIYLFWAAWTDSTVLLLQQEHVKLTEPQSQDLFCFFLGLQAKYLVLASTVREAAAEMKTLQDIQHDYTIETLSKGLDEYRVSAQTLMSLGKDVYEQNPKHEALHANGPLSTHHRMLRDCRTHFSHVEPVEIILGCNDSGDKRYYQYVPVLESLKTIIRHKSAQDLIINIP